jgi:hypothetical protein
MNHSLFADHAGRSFVFFLQVDLRHNLVPS